MGAAARLKSVGEKDYVLELYITGMSEKSMQAIANLDAICKEYLEGHYTLEVIDLYKQNISAEREQIIACPSLVKKNPLPKKLLIGNLSDKKKVLDALGINTYSDAYH